MNSDRQAKAAPRTSKVGFFDAFPTLVVPTVDKIEVFEVSLATGRAVQRVTRNALDETWFPLATRGAK